MCIKIACKDLTEFNQLHTGFFYDKSNDLLLIKYIYKYRLHKEMKIERNTGTVPKEGTLSYGERLPRFELLSMLSELLMQFGDCPVWTIPKWLQSPGVLNIWHGIEGIHTKGKHTILIYDRLIHT